MFDNCLSILLSHLLKYTDVYIIHYESIIDLNVRYFFIYLTLISFEI